MPFTRYDDPKYDKYVKKSGGKETEVTQDGFGYEPAKASFQADKCSPVARVMLDLLKSQDATAFKARYDGGYDEGFSYPETILYVGREESAEVFSRRLAGAEISARIREAAKKDSMWGNAAEFYAESTDDKAIMHALDELSNDLATLLLGNSYGTGEYQLYGRFTADLNSGEITDHRDAEKPESID